MCKRHYPLYIVSDLSVDHTFSSAMSLDCIAQLDILILKLPFQPFSILENDTNFSGYQCGHPRLNLRWFAPCIDRPNCTIVNKLVLVRRKCNFCKRGDAIRKERAAADAPAETEETADSVEETAEAVDESEEVVAAEEEEQYEEDEEEGVEDEPEVDVHEKEIVLRNRTVVVHQ